MRRKKLSLTSQGTCEVRGRGRMYLVSLTEEQFARVRPGSSILLDGRAVTVRSVETAHNAVGRLPGVGLLVREEG